MPKHCAALPGAANELFGSSTAELATALLERLGAAIPAQRDRGSRHAFVLHAPPSYAPRPAAGAVRTTPAATALARATTARNGALSRAARADQALRHRAPSRPTLTAMSVTAVTAVGAAAAITATGGFAAMSPAAVTSPSPVAAAAVLSLTDVSSAADTAPATVAAAAPVAVPVVTAPLANLPAAADLPTVQVPRIVSEATTTAKTLTAPDRPARAAATPRKAAAAAPAHAPGGVDAPAPKATAGTGVGAAALKAAMAKIGKPYSWGAVGPSAFDCSGLMMWAFKQAGVTLPRTSSAQSTAGTAVSKADLRPGDLVFFYSPVSHVGIYLGNGKILNATQSGEPVQISNMAYMPFHNARRI